MQVGDLNTDNGPTLDAVEDDNPDSVADVISDAVEDVKLSAVEEVEDAKGARPDVNQKRPQGRPKGYQAPRVNVERVYQEQKALDELERIRHQIDTLKQSESRVKAEEHTPANVDEPAEEPKLTPYEVRVTRLTERKKSCAD
jgi:hypothetical protein